jgi:hypothetical protein
LRSLICVVRKSSLLRARKNTSQTEIMSTDDETTHKETTHCLKSQAISTRDHVDGNNYVPCMHKQTIHRLKSTRMHLQSSSNWMNERRHETPRKITRRKKQTQGTAQTDHGANSSRLLSMQKKSMFSKKPDFRRVSWDGHVIGGPRITVHHEKNDHPHLCTAGQHRHFLA